MIVGAGTYFGTKGLGEAFSKKSSTTVLGHYPEYVELSNSLNTNRFEVPTDLWNKMTPTDQWTANKEFLDQVIFRGDKIRLATPINKVKPGSFFERELKYLFSRGYKISPDGLWLIK